MRRPPPRWITVFGLGAMRPASGTWGSLPPVALAAILIAAGFGPGVAPWIYHGAIGLVFIAACLACILEGDRAEAHFGRKDPGDAVADEVAGQCIPLMFLPIMAFQTPTLAAVTLVYAFLAFRVLDIVKPWPASGLQQVPGGWGILLDDLIAGLYAAVVVQVMSRMMLA